MWEKEDGKPEGVSNNSATPVILRLYPALLLLVRHQFPMLFQVHREWPMHQPGNSNQGEVTAPAKISSVTAWWKETESHANSCLTIGRTAM